MKTLRYVPIIHTSADMGSLADEITRGGIQGIGAELWMRHLRTVEGFWNALSDYFDAIAVRGMKLYQDGLVAEGEVGRKIVEEGIRAGSKNYILVGKLLQRGAALVKTERLDLVKQELDKLLAITRAKSLPKKMLAYIKYKLTKNKLLKERDSFIARRIEDTLNHGEEGILFIGACHRIIPRLSGAFFVKEIKNAEKVREYQRLLPFCDRHKERFEQLGRYLVSPVTRNGGTYEKDRGN